MVTVFPTSPASGVYVNKKGVEVAVDGLTEPLPSVDIVTCVALPPKILSLTVTGIRKHVVPPAELRVTVGGLLHTF
jgi:hypothetical protein